MQHLECRSQRGESSGRGSCFRTNGIHFDQDFHFKRRKLCLSSSVVVVRVVAAGSRVLPARRSAEVLRDTTIRESDAGQRHRHLPHRHGTPHQLIEFSHQGAVNTLRLVERSHTFEIHFTEIILTMRLSGAPPTDPRFSSQLHGAAELCRFCEGFFLQNLERILEQDDFQCLLLARVSQSAWEQGSPVLLRVLETTLGQRLYDLHAACRE